MIRRKLCATLVFAMLGMGAMFAQSAKYTELLTKAKAYEDKKEWCYALGYYYDAIAEDPTNAEEAVTHYTAICDAIKAGKPGLGEYNEFTLHDSWIPLLQNTEKYWTEFCPKYFTFSEIKKGAVDFKTRTASYSISIKGNSSVKYNEIQGLIEDGYKTAYRSDWTDMPQNWPEISIFSSATDALQNSTALIIGEDSVYPAWNFSNRQYYNESRYGLYELKFNICDESGTVLLECGEYFEENGAYTFDKVPADVMAIIDAGKVKPKLTAIFLKYGMYNKKDDDGSTEFIKHLQQLPIPLEQNEKNSDTCSLEEIIRLSKKKRSLLVEPIVIEKNSGSEVFVEGTGTIQDFYIWKTEVTQSQYENIMGKNPSKFIGANHPVERVSWYDAVAYCNKRSEQEGLMPCYSGSEDSITCDFTANGYRLPTSAEWEYAAKGGRKVDCFTYAGSDNLDEVAWYDDNSGDKTHDVATKKPNTLGLFDMSGNVWEWCWNESGSMRVKRGGGSTGALLWPVRISFGSINCAVSFISSDSASRNSADDLGFRVVRSCSVK